MPDFEKMYFELAGKVADAIELLIAAQQKGEEMYIKGEATTKVTPKTHKTKKS